MRHGQTRAPGCLLVVAAAGYGKTASLEAATGDSISAYHRAADVFDRLTGPDATIALAHVGGRPVAHLVIDDLCRLSAQAQTELTRALATLPPGIRTSLAA